MSTCKRAQWKGLHIKHVHQALRSTMHNLKRTRALLVGDVVQQDHKHESAEGQLTCQKCTSASPLRPRTLFRLGTHQLQLLVLQRPFLLCQDHEATPHGLPCCTKAHAATATDQTSPVKAQLGRYESYYTQKHGDVAPTCCLPRPQHSHKVWAWCKADLDVRCLVILNSAKPDKGHTARKSNMLQIKTWLVESN